MELVFEDAAPVLRTGSFRPSPFEAPVREIAGKTIEVDGKEYPATKSVVINAPNPEEVTKTVSKIQSMGKRCDPPVTVRCEVTPVKDAKGQPVKGKARITFWTVKKITRKAK